MSYDDNIYNTERLRRKRNRQVAHFPSQVQTDGKGNIRHRPLVHGVQLACFAKPIEYYRGEFDRPSRYYDSNGKLHEEPHGCGGCRMHPACGTVVLERVESSPELIEAHADWETATQPLTGQARYTHPSWAAFVEAIERHTWTDSHDADLATHKAKGKAKAKKKKKKAAKAKKRRRPVSPEVRDKISIATDERAALLLAASTAPGAPRYVSKLTPDYCQRRAAVWGARELLKAAGVKVTGKAIAEQLATDSRFSATPIKSLTSRAYEALRRCDMLESSQDGLSPVWPPFELEPPTPPGSSMNPAVVAVLLDDDDDEILPVIGYKPPITP